ncbi:MAG: hypothetical protein JRJ87_05610 [Deltaproteobacteria bacterium]|nr:hypothetical protein [Deltaproteobacteria bacterium]
MSQPKRFGFYSFLIGLFACSCGPQEDGNIALKIHYTQPASVTDDIRGEGAPTQGQPPPYISDFRLCVTAADMEKAKCANFNLADYQQSGKAKIGGIPVGHNRKVTFQGYDFSDRQVYWCGQAEGLSIGKNSTTQVNMFITACTDFTLTRGELETARVFHTATKLTDGRVLIVGGFNTFSTNEICTDGECLRLFATNSIEIYDPMTGLFEVVPGLALNTPRGMHTATLLPDGKVLVAGGCEQAIWYQTFNNGPRTLIEVASQGWGTAGTTGEIIDPASPPVQAISNAMQTSRALHSDLALPNGDVLLVGGMAIGNISQRSATRYTNGNFEEMPAVLTVARQGMLLIPFSESNGVSALVWGGNSPPLAGAGTFAEILKADGSGLVTNDVPGFVSNQSPRGLPAFYASGTSIGTDQVLVTGGMFVDLSMSPTLTKPDVLQKYRVIDLQPGAESMTDPINDTNVMGYFRAFHSTTMLAKKLQAEDQAMRVIIAGGLTSTQFPSVMDFEPQDKAEFFSAWEEEGQAFGPIQIKGISVHMNKPRAVHTATPLDDSSILFVGGFSTLSDDLIISGTAEIFNPTPRQLRIE